MLTPMQDKHNDYIVSAPPVAFWMLINRAGHYAHKRRTRGGRHVGVSINLDRRRRDGGVVRVEWPILRWPSEAATEAAGELVEPRATNQPDNKKRIPGLGWSLPIITVQHGDGDRLGLIVSSDQRHLIVASLRSPPS
jgi:hypothetical protein